jgi:predicted Zn-dependent protease
VLRDVPLLAFVAAVCTACPGGSPPAAGTPDAEKLVTAGNRLDAEIERAGVAFHDPALEAYLVTVAARVAGGRPTPPVRVLRDPSVNGFALPNGSIWVTAGMFAHLANESQLAFVLAHEMTHVDDQHAAIVMSGRSRTKVVTQIAGLALAPIGLADPIAGGVYGLAVAGYGRDFELAADRGAVDRLAAAGYPLGSLPALFDEMDTLDDQDGGGLYSDHPSNAARRAEVVLAIAGRPDGGRAANDAGFRAVTRGAAIESVELWVEAGDGKRALAEADRQLALEPRAAGLHAARGDACRRLAREDVHHLDEARRSYEQALELDPNLGVAYRGLGYVALLRNLPDVARAPLQRYLELTPRAADRRYVQSLLDAQQKKTP